ncbi:glycosyltransferase family 4 protein [Adlercreutzia sp. ZJ242]|uniref:glycosyltransferase family 4 protein n=1 Tax=Adlercreutzia sp. ZJ242 TaxID=2709409 RepID=UPI0013E9B248|nr:glycosyltransferase family 4 protein [Adlercreutzia sp. ZJ242]
MNVLFLSIAGVGDLKGQGIYGDLLKTFRDHGHAVYAVDPQEQGADLPTKCEDVEGVKILRVRTGNLQKCGLVEKGISQLRLERQFLSAIERHFAGVHFDLILYPTPPTTLGGLVGKLKREHGAMTYLLLKDIFPQNSLDLGMLSERGLRGLAYRYFKRTERRTYEVSDFIGCMSEANRRYLVEHEPWIDAEKVEVNPNSLIPRDMPDVDKIALRERLGIPADARLFTYGGNLGKPQAIDFLIRVLRLNEARDGVFFAVAGTGTERHLLEEYFEEERPERAKLLPLLPRKDFDSLLRASDCGVVLLDHRFTIPNFPSRILSYLQAGIPYVAATDNASDVGTLAEAEGFGVRVGSVDEPRFLEACESLSPEELRRMGAAGRRYFEGNCTAEHSYRLIMEHVND